MEIHFVSVVVAFIAIFSIAWYLKYKARVIDDWPIVGTLPSLLWNSNRLPEWFTEVFLTLGGGSFFIDGGVVSKLKYFVTCNPKNLQYILKTNFANFPKGSDFKDIFDILGDGIFSADNDSWFLQRKLAHACFSSVEFRNLVEKVSRKIMENQLLPLLGHAAKRGSVIDLQDVCKRFTFDSAMSVILGRDENYLSIDLPVNEIANVVDDAQEALAYRLASPPFLWKFFRLLKIGREKKLAKAWETADRVLQGYISETRNNLLKGIEATDLLSSHIKFGGESSKDDKFLRDAMLSLFIGGRDTIASGLTWFMWVVAKTPSVEAKIVHELKLIFMKKNKAEGEGGSRTKMPWVFGSEDLKESVYLHAVICESLRLYPPLPINSKSVIKDDILPDGTVVKPGVQIILSFYSEGQMPWIWGEDSLEFKPERWMDEEGKLRHELLSIFYAFNAGPRSCLGKNMSFTQMKMVMAAIIFNFHVELVDGQQIGPKPSISLLMKNPLLVRIQERSI